MRAGLIAGHNVDHIDVASGMRELVACGYPETEVERRYVVQHALQRWARGEEEAAQRGAIDKSFHGIDLTSWTRVLAAAMAGGEARAAQLDGGQEGSESNG
jgi:hypothetical protein